MGSFTRNQSLASSAFTSYLGRTYSSTRTSSWVEARSPGRRPPVVVAVSFHTPRLGSLDSGRSMVAMPYSSVVTVFLKTLIALASWISMMAWVATGFSSESSATSRTCTVWPGL